MMHRKINIWLALAIISLVTIVSALAISAKAVSPGIGLQVLSPPIKCVQDELSPTCLATCPICGNLAGVCTSLFEVKAIKLSGSAMLYQNQALCIYNPTPPNGGIFRPGGQCMGNVFGFGPHFLFNFGCSR
ncbi:MAG: hypothetical protein RB292_05250 [Patescibacteria group bacterium]|jgi:hypothetical protein|nr:hypothetical protein [Patescibacteria group bacterium]